MAEIECGEYIGLDDLLQSLRQTSASDRRDRVRAASESIKAKYSAAFKKLAE